MAKRNWTILGVLAGGAIIGSVFNSPAFYLLTLVLALFAYIAWEDTGNEAPPNED